MLRKLISALCVLFVVAALVGFYLRWTKASRGLEPGQLNEYAKLALELKQTQMNSISQLTIVVLGGIWGLAFGTARKLKARYASIWVTFSAANVAFLLSYFLYLVGNDYLIEILYKANIVDLEAGKLVVYVQWQLGFFALGLALSFVFAVLYYSYSEVKK